MRNAVEIGNNFILTTDNSGGIGEKQQDNIFVSDQTTAYYATRVALLEQWAANAEPITVIIHNFSGSKSWDNYVQGVKALFQETGLPIPTISGSSETNFQLLQSAVAITIIGKQQEKPNTPDIKWFTYGTPLVGNEVTQNQSQIASMQKIHKAIKTGIIHQLWPVGSEGITQEIHNMTKNNQTIIQTILDPIKSAGPATVVLLAIPINKISEAKKHFTTNLNELKITQPKKS